MSYIYIRKSGDTGSENNVIANINSIAGRWMFSIKGFPRRQWRGFEKVDCYDFIIVVVIFLKT